MYDEEEYTDFSPSTLGTKLTAYYDAEQHVRNQVDLDNKQKFDTLSYLGNLLSPDEDITTISGGVILSSIIGVRKGDIMVAGINSSSLAADSTHGTLMIFAGADNATGSTISDNVGRSKFRVYEDGHTVANDLEADSAKLTNAEVTGKITANTGKIGNFDITGGWLNAHSSQGESWQYGIGFSAAAFELESNDITFTSDDEREYISINCDYSSLYRISGYQSAYFMPSGNQILRVQGALSYDSTYRPGFRNIGIYINVSGAADEYYPGLGTDSVGGNYAIFCEAGQFAGLRPKTRIIQGTISKAELTVSKYDYNIIYKWNNDGTLIFPANPVIGQTVRIFKHPTVSSRVLIVDLNGKTSISYNGQSAGNDNCFADYHYGAKEFIWDGSIWHVITLTVIDTNTVYEPGSD